MLLLPAGNPSEWTGPTGNNTYLLTGARPTLVDAGVGQASHLEAIERALGGEPLAQVLVTHGHQDHVGGVPQIRARWPGVVIRNLAPDSCRDGETLRAGDTTLRAIHTPGHSPDHFCYLDEASDDLYCGDLARIGGTIVIPASKGGSLIDYLASLARVRDLAPRQLLPGHGPAVRDAAALIDEYVAHRRQRERQILDALAAGRTTIAQMVADIYGTLSSVLARGAEESVRAHLDKLRIEGRVQQTPDGWTMR